MLRNRLQPEAATKSNSQGYIWGKPVDTLFAALPQDRESWRGFDLIILSDLIFNHSQVNIPSSSSHFRAHIIQHDALLSSCELCLAPISGGWNDTTSLPKPPPCVLVFYTHHRPHLAHRDLEFFAMARYRGWNCEEIYTKKFPVSRPFDAIPLALITPSPCSPKIQGMLRSALQSMAGG